MLRRLFPVFSYHIESKIMPIEYLLPSSIPTDTISLEQALQRRVRRRRRFAKRLVKRFPLFALEFMQTEFPGYDYETFVADVTRKTRPARKKKGRSQLKRQGRYPLLSISESHESIRPDPGSRIPLRGPASPQPAVPPLRSVVLAEWETGDLDFPEYDFAADDRGFVGDPVSKLGGTGGEDAGGSSLFAYSLTENQGAR